MKKKVISFVLVISIMTSLFVTLPITANAETYDIYTYTIENGEVTITDCDENASGDIEIPATINGYTVTVIGEYAFLFCETLTSIVIPNGVTIIEKRAFSWCTGLINVAIPESVTSIGEQAFYKCTSLTDITIPRGVIDIGPCAFEECRSLASLTISDGIRNIGEYAFVNCDSLKSIYIPDSVIDIGKFAFFGCYDVTDVYYGGTEDEWNSITIGEDNEYLTDATIHFGVEPEPSYTLGDSNGDDEIDIKDVISIRRFIAGGYNTTIVNKAADINKDNTVDVRDAIVLRRLIAGGYGGQESEIVKRLKAVSEEITPYVEKGVADSSYVQFSPRERNILKTIKTCIDDAIVNHAYELDSDFIKRTYITEISEVRAIYDSMVAEGMDDVFIGKMAIHFSIYSFIWIADTIGVDLEKYGIIPSDYI